MLKVIFAILCLGIIKRVNIFLGWKVLLTSRNENVAGDTRHINFNLELLTTDDSWTLLQTIAFPRKDAFGEGTSYNFMRFYPLGIL